MSESDIAFQELVDGDVTEMEKFTMQFYALFVSFALRYVDNKSFCEDIVQESFISFSENKNNFPDLTSAKGYLFKLLKNKSLNYLRHLKVRENYRDEAIRNINNVDTEKHFVESIIKSESDYYVRKAILELSGMGQKVITLSMRGLSNEEIAFQLDVTISTIKTHKQRGYQALRKKLAFLRLLVFFVNPM